MANHGVSVHNGDRVRVMDVAAFLLAGQNLTHSSAPNLLVYDLHGIRSVVPAAAHLKRYDSGFVHMRGLA